MQYDEFMKQVQELAQLESRQTAEQATRATLETIAERILGNEASQLAAQLPAQLGQFLRGHEGENGHHFPLSEFYQRVAQKAELTPDAVATPVQAVFLVLSQAVTPGEWADVKSNFSEDYQALLSSPEKV